jgi:hypothetical protein
MQFHSERFLKARRGLIQGCQIVLATNLPKSKNVSNDHKVWQTAVKFTKWPHTIPNCHKILQHFQLKGTTRFTQIGIFGLKKNIWQHWVDNSNYETRVV